MRSRRWQVTAATEDTSRTGIVSPRIKYFPVRALNQAAAAIKINKGDLVCKRKGTNLAEVPEEANPRTDLIPLGIAMCAIDMTGKGDGDLSVAVCGGGWRDFDTGSGANEITPATIGSLCYMYNNNTLYATNAGGTLSAFGPVMFADVAEDGGVAAYVDFELAGVVHELATLMAASSANSLQFGTGTLVAGEATIATATITATSRILVAMKDPGAGAITGFAAFDVPVADRVVGAPGSFKVRAIDDAKALIATAVCTFDWIKVG